MFRVRDIVKHPDGRKGIINSINKEGKIIVQFGSYGPHEFCSEETLRFADSKRLEASGGRNFFRNISMVKSVTRRKK